VPFVFAVASRNAVAPLSHDCAPALGCAEPATADVAGDVVVEFGVVAVVVGAVFVGAVVVGGVVVGRHALRPTATTIAMIVAGNTLLDVGVFTKTSENHRCRVFARTLLPRSSPCRPSYTL
jgi:hypothetical protein